MDRQLYPLVNIPKTVQKSNGTSYIASFMGKLTVNGPCSIAMLVITGCLMFFWEKTSREKRSICSLSCLMFDAEVHYLIGLEALIFLEGLQRIRMAIQPAEKVIEAGKSSFVWVLIAFFGSQIRTP